jgi:two-component system, NarL family, nitrate/nitrite response regulator NarL
MAERVQVMIADDHPLFREALTDAVRARPSLELVGTAEDGHEALEMIRELGPAVAVLDVRMPELDGLAVLNAVRRDELGTQVLFCATSTESSLVYDCMAAGAAGYLDKGSAAKEICEAIATVARGETVLGDRVEPGVLQQIRLRGEGPVLKLTKRELEMLRYLAEGLSAPEIAKELVIEPSTVKSHLKSLYEKLGVSDRAAAVATGMRQGLVE